MVSGLGGAVLGSLAAGLMVSSAGVLSRASGPIDVDSDMNSSHTFNISNVNSSYLKCSTLTSTDYSNIGGWQNQINNIPNTNITSNSGSFTRLYGDTLWYDTLVPSGGYITNDVNNINTTSTNTNCTNLSSTGIHCSITSNISQLNVSSISCVNLSSIIM